MDLCTVATAPARPAKTAARLKLLPPRRGNDTMYLVTKSQLIERIQELSDEELEQVGPYLEADLEALAPNQDLVAEIERGQASAHTEPSSTITSLCSRRPLVCARARSHPLDGAGRLAARPGGVLSRQAAPRRGVGPPRARRGDDRAHHRTAAIVPARAGASQRRGAARVDPALRLLVDLRSGVRAGHRCRALVLANATETRRLEDRQLTGARRRPQPISCLSGPVQ